MANETKLTILIILELIKTICENHDRDCENCPFNIDKDMGKNDCMFTLFHDAEIPSGWMIEKIREELL